MIPPLIVYFVFQRNFVRGVALSRGWDRFWGLTRLHYRGPDSTVEIPDPEVIAADDEYRTFR